jgi:hypothetical protein
MGGRIVSVASGEVVMLSISFDHTTSRIAVDVARPGSAGFITDAICCSRGDSVLSGSPITKVLLVALLRITPGDDTSLGDVTTQPMARCTPSVCHRRAPGSSRARRSLAGGRPGSAGRPWKYHQGTPLIANITGVSGPSRGCIASTTWGNPWAFTAEMTRSCGPRSRASLFAATRTVKSSASET